MFTLDLTPLRRSPAFRRLFIARACSLLIYGILGTSIYLQLGTLSSASLHVAAVSAIMALSMALSLLSGGSLADRTDRRRLILWSRTAYLAGVALLFGNSLLDQPAIWPIYMAALIGGVTSGISIPALMAVTPTLLPREDLSAAAALGAMTVQAGAILGPALAGLLTAVGGFAASYAIVAIGACLTVLVLIGLPDLPPPAVGDASTRPLRGDAIGFILRQPFMLRLLLIDLCATVCVTPFALLPRLGREQLGLEIGGTSLLFSAFAAGALLASLSVNRGRFTARPIETLCVVAIFYGLAAILLGAATGVVLALLALLAMGFTDGLSEIIRTAFVQRETPSPIMGRVSALWMLQASVSPAIGNVMMGALADHWSMTWALVLGGIACVTSSLTIAISVSRSP